MQGRPPAPAPPEFEVVWMRPKRRGRGPRPAHSRDEIAAAAVRIADAEGIEALSMRRVAAAVGTGTTSLYRYLSSKDDLLDLMVDAVIGESQTPTSTGDWRADLRAIAHATRAMILRHPWVAALPAGRSSLGPNSLRATEFALGVVDGLGLDVDEMVVTIDALLAFVRGYVMNELAEQEATRRSGLDMDQWMAAQIPYGRTIMESGRYPHLTRVMVEAKGPHAANRFERGFGLGLDRILDGFAASLPASSVSRESDPRP